MKIIRVLTFAFIVGAVAGLGSPAHARQQVDAEVSPPRPSQVVVERQRVARIAAAVDFDSSI